MRHIMHVLLRWILFPFMFLASALLVAAVIVAIAMMLLINQALIVTGMRKPAFSVCTRTVSQ